MDDLDGILNFDFADPPAPDDFIRAAMRWHFSPATGSPFWLRRAASLGFDPLVDVKSFDDLRLFPDLTRELRDVPAEQLIPRGFGTEPDIAGVFESGGTTGPAKRVVFTRDWMERTVEFERRDLARRGFPQGTDWLAMLPGRPHMVGAFYDHESARFGRMQFAIDMDPRWMKRLIAQGDRAGAEAYAEHLIDQAENVLRSQDIGILLISPPLLERLARRPELVELVRSKVKGILWGGAHMDPDTRRLLRTGVFPTIPLVGGYGSTMFLGAARERAGLSASDPCVFDSHPYHTTFNVVDQSTGQAVAYGQRGRVVASHVSKAMFIPNNVERDTAVRVEPARGQVGDAVADVAPVSTYDGEAVIEGVY